MRFRKARKGIQRKNGWRLLSFMMAWILTLCFSGGTAALEATEMFAPGEGKVFVPASVMTDGWNTITTPFSNATVQVTGDGTGASVQYSYSFLVEVYVQNNIITKMRQPTIRLSADMTATPSSMGTASPEYIGTSYQILSSGAGVLVTASFRMRVRGYSASSVPYDLFGNAYCSRAIYP